VVNNHCISKIDIFNIKYIENMSYMSKDKDFFTFFGKKKDGHELSNFYKGRVVVDDRNYSMYIFIITN
jgi:hypothetical protein